MTAMGKPYGGNGNPTVAVVHFAARYDGNGKETYGNERSDRPFPSQRGHLPMTQTGTIHDHSAGKGGSLDRKNLGMLYGINLVGNNNSLFFKTERGALVGDMFMSLIHTCRLNGVNAFDYLTAIAQHAQDVAKAPGEWLPWNYRNTLVRCASP